MSVWHAPTMRVLLFTFDSVPWAGGLGRENNHRPLDLSVTHLDEEA